MMRGRSSSSVLDFKENPHNMGAAVPNLRRLSTMHISSSSAPEEMSKGESSENRTHSGSSTSHSFETKLSASIIKTGYASPLRY